jgi:hypothetical protein
MGFLPDKGIRNGPGLLASGERTLIGPWKRYNTEFWYHELNGKRESGIYQSDPVYDRKWLSGKTGRNGPPQA